MLARVPSTAAVVVVAQLAGVLFFVVAVAGAVWTTPITPMDTGPLGIEEDVEMDVGGGSGSDSDAHGDGDGDDDGDADGDGDNDKDEDDANARVDAGKFVDTGDVNESNGDADEAEDDSKNDKGDPDGNDSGNIRDMGFICLGALNERLSSLLGFAWVL